MKYPEPRNWAPNRLGLSVERDALLEQRVAAIARDEVTIQQRDARIEQLQEQVRLLLARRFGPRRRSCLTGSSGCSTRPRPRRARPEPFVLGALAIDYGRRRVTVGGETVGLTATEYELLRVLSVDAGRVVAYETLLEQVGVGREGARAPVRTGCASS